jgi:hypothetical protein
MTNCEAVTCHGYPVPTACLQKLEYPFYQSCMAIQVRLLLLCCSDGLVLGLLLSHPLQLASEPLLHKGLFH